MDQEIESFQYQINLTEYAAHLGYKIERRASSRNSVVMRTEYDKVVIAVGYTGKWIYFSVRDDFDNGTIIDFVQHRHNGFNLGHVRKELRPWTGGQGIRPTVQQTDFIRELQSLTKDRQQVLESFHRMTVNQTTPYLTKQRLIPAEILTSERFTGCILTDERSNTVFPHRDRDGVCGFEIKNTRFTGFSKHGAKGYMVLRRKTR